LKLIKRFAIQIKQFEKAYKDILLQYNLIPKTELSDARKIIEQIFSRFDLIARQIKCRYNNRSTLEINDEHDVQDLLHSLLLLYFDDIRREEYAPSYAGISPRMDLLIKDEGIVIECKMVKKGRSEKQIRNELIIDKEHYRGHPDCKLLYCFVYDPEKRIKNPRGFEKDLSSVIGGFETKVFVIQ